MLIEFRAVVTRKFKPPLSFKNTRAALQILGRFEVVPANANLMLDAHELAGAKKLAWFDSPTGSGAIEAASWLKQSIIFVR